MEPREPLEPDMFEYAERRVGREYRTWAADAAELRSNALAEMQAGHLTIARVLLDQYVHHLHDWVEHEQQEERLHGAAFDLHAFVATFRDEVTALTAVDAQTLPLQFQKRYGDICELVGEYVASLEQLVLHNRPESATIRPDLSGSLEPGRSDLQPIEPIE